LMIDEAMGGIGVILFNVKRWWRVINLGFVYV
jgi:hypothetical protein